MKRKQSVYHPSSRKMLIQRASILLLGAEFLEFAGAIETALQPIAGFVPGVVVTDHNALDMDLQDMEDLFNADLPEFAMAVYERGGNSRPYAKLTIEGEGGLPVDIPAHSLVYGVTDLENRVFGMTKDAAKAGTKELHVLYEISSDQDNYVHCRVGARPVPEFNGCFNAIGNLTVQTLNIQIPYRYDPEMDNLNDRAIASFTKQAFRKMKPCNNCDFYPIFDKFYEFYGRADYADAWINAAANSGKVEFDIFGSDFSKLNFESRAASIMAASVTMVLAMYIIREMDHAVGQCHNCLDEGCNDLMLGDVDGAVAFYAGSMEGRDGSGEGKLLYSIADRECKYFKTCGMNGNEITGRASVNLRIIENFQAMQQNITEVTKESCPVARRHKDEIAKLMFIPIIQATLRHAYNKSNGSFLANDTDKALGATYAASILPLVAHCSYHDAQIIMDNLDVTKEATFDEVLQAFQNRYVCLGLTCKDIGGLWDAENNDYFKGFEPCGIEEEEVVEEEEPKKFSMMSLILAVGILPVLYYCCCQRKSTPKRKTGDDDFSDSSDDSDISFRR